MTKAIAIARQNADQAQDALRLILVSGCGMALVLAGQSIPF